MAQPTFKLGSELPYATQRDCIATFTHRFTRDHVPQWTRQPRPCGNPYPLHFDSDGDWLAHTRFAVTKGGKLDARVTHCESSPTWPDGKA